MIDNISLEMKSKTFDNKLLIIEIILKSRRPGSGGDIQLSLWNSVIRPKGNMHTNGILILYSLFTIIQDDTQIRI